MTRKTQVLKLSKGHYYIFTLLKKYITSIYSTWCGLVCLSERTKQGFTTDRPLYTYSTFNVNYNTMRESERRRPLYILCTYVREPESWHVSTTCSTIHIKSSFQCLSAWNLFLPSSLLVFLSLVKHTYPFLLSFSILKHSQFLFFLLHERSNDMWRHELVTRNQIYQLILPR